MLRPFAISVRDLSRPPELEHVSFAIPVGARVLVASDPPAAASTLLRVLAGLARARRGRIEIAGLTSPGRDGWGSRVGYLAPEPGMYPWMSPREALELAARVLGLAGDQVVRRVEAAMTWCAIDREAARAPLARGGPPLLQRTGLAGLLVGNPEVVLLDEPLRAFDPTERQRLLRLPGGRRTVLMASRYPSADVGLVSHLALIREGRVRFIARVADLEAAGLPASLRGLEMLAERTTRRASVHRSA